MAARSPSAAAGTDTPSFRAVGTHAILPMAITKADDRFACVGALTEHGEWVRPEPVPVAQVTDRTTSAWQYGQWTTVELAAPTVADPRPEDRALVAAPAGDETWTANRYREWAARYVDPDVERALSGERSLGLVQVTLHRVYVRASTRGRFFVRFEFTDSTDTAYDWIVPDVEVTGRLLGRLEGGKLPASVAEETLAGLREHGPLLVAIGLTRPNNRFPGRFRGCHPLVVGVHPAGAAS
jgi:hypothetical protein